VLSLTSVSLSNNSAEDLVHAINISALESLTLRGCDDSGEFLSLLARSSALIRLKTFEVTAAEGLGGNGDRKIAEFVESFKGLQELFVQFAGPKLSPFRVWTALAGHRTTLKRFIYHKRMVLGPWPQWDLLDSIEDLGIPDLGLDAPEQHPQANPIRCLEVECLGLSCRPYILVRVVPCLKSESLIR
jgi:hypothetical protein